MATAEKLSASSWTTGASPLTLGEILNQETSVSVWLRDARPEIEHYFESVFGSLELGVRQVFSMEALKEGLAEALPEGTGKLEAIEDIYLLADMLTCLFGCEHVGLRLTALSSAMCPKFHVDNIPVRLVNTYLGPGTEWLPNEAVFESANPQAKDELAIRRQPYFFDAKQIQQLGAYDVALLKGSAWEGHEDRAAVHRSCQLQSKQKRVLLTLDPL